MEYQYALPPTLLDNYFRYKRSEDELSFIQLIDRINGIRTEPDEARLKGIAFEELINHMIEVENSTLQIENEMVLFKGFEFKSSIVYKFYDKLKHCSKIQSSMEKIIDTPRGKVKLYGIFDYEFPNMMADAKTTASYRYGKYEDNMQHKFTSLMTDFKEFNYVATDFEYFYMENYWLTNKLRKQAIIDIVEFIDFINFFKKLITNTKIYGL